MNKIINAIFRIFHSTSLKIYCWLFSKLMRVFFNPFRVLYHFDSLREPLDYFFQTNIKEIIAKEFDKCISQIPVRGIIPPPPPPGGGRRAPARRGGTG